MDITLNKMVIRYIKTVLAACAAMLFCGAMESCQGQKSDLGYVIVTDYVKANGKKDVSDIIQKIIDDNPHRTIYFPDGIYLLSKPIKTPANPQLSVSLELSNYAILKASENWSDSEAMVRLGAIHPANNILFCWDCYL